MCLRVPSQIIEAVALSTVAWLVIELSIVTWLTLRCYVVNGHWHCDGIGDAFEWSLAVVLNDFSWWLCETA